MKDEYGEEGQKLNGNKCERFPCLLDAVPGE